MKNVLFKLFLIHDCISEYLAKNLGKIKLFVLIVAHICLFGLFFPELRRYFGSLASTLLIAILFLSPLATLFPIRLLKLGMALRREFGIMMGYLALVHTFGYLLDKRFVENIIFGNKFYIGFLFGSIAFVFIAVLLMTSNNFFMRFLGAKWWKRTHFLVYPAFVLVVLHIATARKGFVFSPKLFDGLMLISVFIFLKLLAWKRFLPFLDKINTFVALRYDEYKRMLLEKYKN